eukprot:CAMPEP_0202859082 /NCGR_PEP_ID=MMETSP1391-20130828/1357_1 /ASSEMBLY_ACC=CAM_ASM_000867 /TAXON_ID=1034604 /ORGANISM="Chlamydomonas leiostraca, Strain SAG 11-49" /LENGTH=144 /DNA_ID=CAMNT_0049538087 /DNA_START=58 /DNA_END=493 /DNA_ORIENTATION=-
MHLIKWPIPVFSSLQTEEQVQPNPVKNKHSTKYHTAFRAEITCKPIQATSLLPNQPHLTKGSGQCSTCNQKLLHLQDDAVGEGEEGGHLAASPPYPEPQPPLLAELGPSPGGQVCSNKVKCIDVEEQEELILRVKPMQTACACL